VSRIFTEDSARTAPHRTGRQQLRTSAQAAQLVNRIFTEASAGSESSAPARPPALRSSPRSWPAGEQDLHRGISRDGDTPDRPAPTSIICPGRPDGGRIFPRTSAGSTGPWAPTRRRRAPRSSPWSWPAGE
jgi:hypothetical protein